MSILKIAGLSVGTLRSLYAYPLHERVDRRRFMPEPVVEVDGVEDS